MLGIHLPGGIGDTPHLWEPLPQISGSPVAYKIIACSRPSEAVMNGSDP